MGLIKKPEKTVFVDKWEYLMPDLKPDEDGNTVLISMRYWGPLQVEEYGINDKGIPYHYYRWVEDDFFDNTPEITEISWDTLQSHILSTITMFEKADLPKWVKAYRDIYAKFFLRSFQEL